MRPKKLGMIGFQHLGHTHTQKFGHRGFALFPDISENPAELPSSFVPTSEVAMVLSAVGMTSSEPPQPLISQVSAWDDSHAASPIAEIGEAQAPSFPTAMGTLICPDDARDSMLNECSKWFVPVCNPKELATYVLF
jgi:hypothetical protein